MKRIQLTLPDDAVKKLREIAYTSSMQTDRVITVNELIRLAVEHFLKSKGGK